MPFRRQLSTPIPTTVTATAGALQECGVSRTFTCIQCKPYWANPLPERVSLKNSPYIELLFNSFILIYLGNILKG